MYYYNDKPLPLDKAFTDINGNQYPANWLRNSTQAQRDALGITWVAPDPAAYYDQRFYWGVGNPKDLNELVVKWLQEQKETALNLLSGTDWRVIRMVEHPELGLPTAITEYRESVRNVSNLREAQISACTTVDELAALITAPSTIEVVVQDAVPATEDSLDIPLVVETQVNPDALVVFPELNSSEDV
jgi:hypothetical protein